MKTNNSGASFPILGILGLIFITLKLTGHIAWSWWWVLSPFWGPLAIILIVSVVVFTPGMWATIYKELRK